MGIHFSSNDCNEFGHDIVLRVCLANHIYCTQYGSMLKYPRNNCLHWSTSDERYRAPRSSEPKRWSQFPAPSQRCRVQTFAECSTEVVRGFSATHSDLAVTVPCPNVEGRCVPKKQQHSTCLTSCRRHGQSMPVATIQAARRGIEGLQMVDSQHSFSTLIVIAVFVSGRCVTRTRDFYDVNVAL